MPPFFGTDPRSRTGFLLIPNHLPVSAQQAMIAFYRDGIPTPRKTTHEFRFLHAFLVRLKPTCKRIVAIASAARLSPPPSQAPFNRQPLRPAPSQPTPHFRSVNLSAIAHPWRSLPFGAPNGPFGRAPTPSSQLSVGFSRAHFSTFGAPNAYRPRVVCIGCPLPVAGFSIPTRARPHRTRGPNDRRDGA